MTGSSFSISNSAIVIVSVIVIAIVTVIAIVIVIAVLQFLIKIFTGATNDKLEDFGSSLGIFVAQIYSFISFKSDERPYPFDKDWPESN